MMEKRNHSLKSNDKKSIGLLSFTLFLLFIYKKKFWLGLFEESR